MAAFDTTKGAQSYRIDHSSYQGFFSFSRLWPLFLCAFTHAYLLFSILPYAGYFAVYLVNDADHERVTIDSVGIYVGLLGSSFTLGRTLGFRPWKLARLFLGERRALAASLLLSAICSLGFGFASTFTTALLFRFCLGLSNGISGSVKRAAIVQVHLAKLKSAAGETNEDTTEDDQEWVGERVLAAMSWGCALGPAIGGVLAEPTVTISIHSLSHPFLLPNACGALLCIFSMIGVLFTDLFEVNSRQNPLVGATSSSHGETSTLIPKGSDSRNDTDNQRNDDDMYELKNVKKRLEKIWKTRSTRYHFLAYCSFSFCVVIIDEALPLFLVSRLSGPGLCASKIGMILVVSGIVSLIFKDVHVGRLLTEKMGIYPSLKLSSFMGTVPAVLFYFTNALNGGTYATNNLLGGPGLSFGAFLLDALIVIIVRLFSTTYLALIGVGTCRTVPEGYKDDLSRIMTFGALFARSVAPFVVGWVATVFLPISNPFGFWFICGGLFGVMGSWATYILNDPAASSVTNRRQNSDIYERRERFLSDKQRSSVHTKLWEVHWDRGSDTVAGKWRKAARKAIVMKFLTGSEKHSDTSRKLDKSHARHPSWASQINEPKNAPQDMPFILGTHKNDSECSPHVLTPPLLWKLQQFMPLSARGSNYWLRYSLARDGSSLVSLLDRVGLAKQTLLAIETLDGHLFGSFTNNVWKKTNNSFVFDGESFLWRRKSVRSASSRDSWEDESLKEEDVEVFKWTGENEYCQLLASDRLAVGGGSGFGLCIDQDLLTGSSAPCETYGNPCLSGDSECSFEIANVEVWAMTPHFFVEDAMRSERSINFREKNAIQGLNPSSQSVWSQFL